MSETKSDVPWLEVRTFEQAQKWAERDGWLEGVRDPLERVKIIVRLVHAAAKDREVHAMLFGDSA